MTADKAHDRLAQLLNALPRIADKEWHTIDEVERTSGIGVPRLLAELHDVGGRADDRAGYISGLEVYIRPDAISVHSQHFRRPMLLTPREAAAIELGLALVEGERPPDDRPAISRLREKVRSALTTKPTGTIRGSRARTTELHAEAAASGDPRIVAILRRAMRERQVAEIEYQQGGSTIPTSLRVHSYALAAERGKWLLWGYCESTGQRRLFRVDRVSSVKTLPGRFERPADADQMPAKGRGYGKADGPTVTVEYSARIANWIIERLNEKPLVGLGVREEAVTIEHPLHNAGWAVRNVLQYGPEAVVIAPPAIREAVRATLEAMLDEGQKVEKISPKTEAGRKKRK